MNNKDLTKSKYRFRGEKYGGIIVESNDINAFDIKDFIWIEETTLLTIEEFNKIKKFYE